ncbi:hypothetical protein HDU79_000256 [Rhizoclosmatium sp. JEL0117]|nr:hypothetical protein HDU79_000256 [Rhizoclosmatium sp. JEL0117]
MTKCQEPAFVWDFRANGATATHTSLSGGKSHVPLEQYNEFLKQYASAILAGSAGDADAAAVVTDWVLATTPLFLTAIDVVVKLYDSIVV